MVQSRVLSLNDVCLVAIGMVVSFGDESFTCLLQVRNNQLSSPELRFKVLIGIQGDIS